VSKFKSFIQSQYWLSCVSVIDGCDKSSLSFNWIVGDEIAIASTSYNPREGERRFITAIDNTNAAKPVLTLDKALEFRHYAEDYAVGT
jgi:hypothetical protein